MRCESHFHLKTTERQRSVISLEKGKVFKLKILTKALPSVSHRHNSSFVLGNVLEDRLREIKVVLGRVAPTPIVVRKSIVWWAEIGGCNHNGARQAPPGVAHTLNLIARPTAQPIVEQSCAQSCSVCPIPLAIQVPIATSSTCTNFTNKCISKTWPHNFLSINKMNFIGYIVHTHCPRSITTSIEGSMSISPTSTTITMNR